MHILTDGLKIEKGKAEMSTSPPVPQGLREMLKDYPEHIVRLQEVLNHVMQTSSAGVDPFDRAIWVIESRLGTFISEAREELNTAEVSGDGDAIARAILKLNLMIDCRPSIAWKLKQLMEYFDGVRKEGPHGY